MHTKGEQREVFLHSDVSYSAGRRMEIHILSCCKALSQLLLNPNYWKYVSRTPLGLDDTIMSFSNVEV